MHLYEHDTNTCQCRTCQATRAAPPHWRQRVAHFTYTNQELANQEKFCQKLGLHELPHDNHHTESLRSHVNTGDLVETPIGTGRIIWTGPSKYSDSTRVGVQYNDGQVEWFNQEDLGPPQTRKTLRHRLSSLLRREHGQKKR